MPSRRYIFAGITTTHGVPQGLHDFKSLREGKGENFLGFHLIHLVPGHMTAIVSNLRGTTR